MSNSRTCSLLAMASVSLLITACGPSEGAMGEMGAMGGAGPKGDMGAPGTMGTPGGAGTSGLPGIACWDLNSNRMCDLATEDTDNDTQCDPADCAGLQGPAGTAGTAGQRAGSVFGSAALTLSPTATTGTLIPGLTQTLTIPAASVTYISSDGGILTTGAAVTDFSLADVAVAVDGTLLANGGYQQIVAANSQGITGSATWSFTVAVPLAAGAHTISVLAFGKSIGSDAQISGPSGNVRQASLTVMVLKL